MGDDWVDDYGTGATRPDLEALYEDPSQHSSEAIRGVIWWAWALESRVHHLELGAEQATTPTAGEVLAATHAGDQEARRAVDDARAEAEGRKAERVEELRRQLGRARLTDRHWLDARRGWFAEMLEAFLSEFGLTTLEELRRELRRPDTSRSAD